MDVIAVKRNGLLIAMSRSLQKPESRLQGSSCHKEIHNHDLLVSGLHCQYYSIMKNNSANIEENKGVLIQKVYLYNADVMMNGRIYSVEVTPRYEPFIPLRKILEQGTVDERYFLREEDMPKWIYAKGAKHEQRRRRDGSVYWFNEGAVGFPDSLDKPSRTMLTSETQVGRTSHVITDLQTGRLRVLTPIECERLNGFPDNWTNTGMPEKMRYFCMGNALVVDIIKTIAYYILMLL